MSQANANQFDWTQLLNEYDYARPQRGEVREGVVMKVESRFDFGIDRFQHEVPSRPPT
jgi:hypothetical protein